MHLLQAGIDVAVIALWLGHESIETTHIYVEADLAIKERALERIAQRIPLSADIRPTIRSWPFSPHFNIPSSYQ